MRQELVERARRGDRDAFALLAAGEVDHLHAIARLLLRDPELAEDAVQEALVRCWRQLPKLRDVERFDGWLYRILVRTAADEYGRRRRHEATVQAIAMEPSVPDGTGDLADREELEAGFRRVRIAVPGPGPGVCVRWSSDGTHLAYLDGGVVVVRGLDGSTRASVAGDPGAGDFAPTPQWSDPVLSPSREWSVRLTDSGIVVAHPDGTFAHIIPLTYSPYSIAAWSPDGRQVLLMEDVSGHDFTMHAIAVDSDFKATIVSTVRTNGARSWPGSADVSWQPVFP